MSRRFTWPVLLACAATLVACPIAEAQTCEPLPVDDASPSHYQFRKNSPRCEGLYLSSVRGSTRMSLISLTFGRPLYTINVDKFLEISVPVTSNKKTEIHGGGLPSRFYYRLDAELAPGQRVFKLPLTDVIAREGITPNKLGFYAVRTTAENEDAFVPVHIASATKAATDDDIIAVFRSDLDITDVWWRRYAQGSPPSPWAAVTAARRVIPAGEPIEIQIGNSTSPQTILGLSFRSDRGVDGAANFLLVMQ
jgi:hypothetical protein